MTEESSAGGANAIEARQVGGNWFVRRAGTQFWGEGATLTEAYDALCKREAEYRAFLERADIPIIPATGLKRWFRGAARPVGRVLAAVAIFALFMVPVSYAISTGISRGVKETEIKVGGREFWEGLERRIIEFSTERHDLPPEKVEALREAVHRIVLRIRPFTSELRQLLEPVPETTAAPPETK